MRQTYVKNTTCIVRGFIVPLEFIRGMSLMEIERTLGLAAGRLDRGAAFALLNGIPAEHELEYFGDTRSPEHRFEQVRNKQIGRQELNNAAYNYIQTARPKLIKVIAIKDHNPMMTEDQNWPSGHGAMQYKLIVNKPAMIVDLVESYPTGRFSYQ